MSDVPIASLNVIAGCDGPRTAAALRLVVMTEEVVNHVVNHSVCTNDQPAFWANLV
jgi:hypothetical protein